MRIQAEVLFGRISGKQFRFHVSRVDLTRRHADPTEVVAALSLRRHPELEQWSSPRLVHSTSWRHQAGQIFLTYLVYSDDLVFSGAVRRVALSALPSAKSSRKVPSANMVAAHALRHLAFLCAEDPRSYEDRLESNTRKQLSNLRPAVAGRLKRRR
jgi:hypothetical protein